MAVLDSSQMNQLVREVTQAIQSNSQGVGELPEVSSLAGINSLPTLRNGNQVVVTPISLLEKPATDAAARADAAASQAVQIASDAVAEAQSSIKAAVDNANDTATHPTYIGEDNYVYTWNKDTKTYNKTSIYVRGEGFSISKTYRSVADMNADSSHGLKEGDFVLINTGDVENPDNARIYVVNAQGSFTFLVDMSGAIGFTGKTPQIEIGIVNVGANRSEASASLTANGVDKDGNPKYLLNLLIPSLTVQDFTDEEIAILQQPALEMVSILQTTNEAVNAAEEIRQASETDRVNAEETRLENEVGRASAESLRVEAELERDSDESIRRTNETMRINNELERQDFEESRRTYENARIVEESSRQAAELVRAETEAVRVSVEEERAQNEQLRQAQEESRAAEESVRANAESIRMENEDVRNVSETYRNAAESVRLSNEQARQSNEDERKSKESQRATAESSRESAESARQSAESRREGAESTRQSAENVRLASEAARVSDEAKRNSAEAVRLAAEENRVSNENSRINAEKTRASNEESRVASESERAADYAELRRDIVTATENANNAASESRNTPVIRNGTWWIFSAASDSYMDTGTPAVAKAPQIINGTWWTWDDVRNELVDTGQSVSSDYQLTKEKIEGVFTGDIDTHSHDRYLINDIDTIRSGAALGATALQSVPSEYVTDTELQAKGYAVAAEVSEALQQGLATRQPNIPDLDTIRSGASLGATALQSVPSEYVTDTELQAKGYAVATEVSEALQQGLATRQPNIADLDTIRSGAALGATALQSVPSEYVTDTELDAKGYAVAAEANQALQQGLATKQDKNLYFTGIAAVDWQADSTYEVFKYRCDLPCPGVLSTDYAEVVFGIDESTSGDYAPICESLQGVVRIWSATNKGIMVPTVIVNR